MDEFSKKGRFSSIFLPYSMILTVLTSSSPSATIVSVTFSRLSPAESQILSSFKSNFKEERILTSDKNSAVVFAADVGELLGEGDHLADALLAQELARFPCVGLKIAKFEKKTTFLKFQKKKNKE